MRIWFELLSDFYGQVPILCLSREVEFLIKDFIHLRHPPQFLYCQRK